MEGVWEQKSSCRSGADPLFGLSLWLHPTPPCLPCLQMLFPLNTAQWSRRRETLRQTCYLSPQCHLINPLKPFKPYQLQILWLNKNYLMCLSEYAIYIWFSNWVLMASKIQNILIFSHLIHIVALKICMCTLTGLLYSSSSFLGGKSVRLPFWRALFCFVAISPPLLGFRTLLYFLCHLANISTLLPFIFQGHPPLILTLILLVHGAFKKDGLINV